MAGRPRKTSIIKEIGEAAPAIDEKAVEVSEKKETTIDDYLEKELKSPEFRKVYESTPVRKGTVRANPWLNVRSGAGDFPVIGTLNPGASVDIYEIKDGFGKISATEEKWVNLDFIV